MGIVKKKTIYGHVRCETKHCDNNFKLLKIPKILAGKQKYKIYSMICNYDFEGSFLQKNELFKR